MSEPASGNPYCAQCGREVFVSAGEPTHIHSEPIALVRLPDGTYQLLDGRRVESHEGQGDRMPPAWKMRIRPYDWADGADNEWGHPPKGLCFLVPTEGPGFTRARVVSQAEVTITDLSPNRPATAERRTA